ncbi:MAG: efflux transporter outer membrane subunit [Nitrospirae bacterium]|nr:efflux transporter outer membrane subunit [Nitrospirota bacterium]
MAARAIAPWAAVLAVLAAGCAAGPDYAPAEIAAPEAWHGQLEVGLTPRAADPDRLAHWWEALGDPVLPDLISRAVAENLDLRQAQARVLEARARRGVARSGWFPTLQADVSAGRSGAGVSTGGSVTRTLYAAGFDARWELDLFGGVRRADEAARAQEEASIEDLHDVLVSLTAEVALNYVELRAFESRLAIVQASVAAQRDTYDLARWRRDAGLATDLDVERARSSLAQSQAQIPTLRTGRAQAANRLAVLLGRPPGAPDVAMSGAGPIPAPPPEVAVGIPADALQRRPDVRRAERRLAAQTAQVGVAASGRWPAPALTGSIGLEAANPARLVTDAVRTFAVGAGIPWTLFDGGRLRQGVAVQDALREQALVAYQAAVLAALADVEDALAAYAGEQARRAALAEAVGAAERAADLAREQYAAGLADNLAVLDAQRSLLSLQDQMVVSEGGAVSALIRLYKALGGGWSPLPPQGGSGMAG